MGAAKRRAMARWSRLSCDACRFIDHLAETEPDTVEAAQREVQIAAYEKDHPHTHQPDPGPQPAVKLSRIEIILPSEIVGAINELYEFVDRHFASRNEFLVELLQEGVKVAALAQRAAQEAMERQAQAAVVEPLVQLATHVPAGMKDASDRLRALRGEP